MQNDDIAVVSGEGVLSLHRIKRESAPSVQEASPRSRREMAVDIPSPRAIDILDTKVSKAVDIHSLLLREIHEQVYFHYTQLRQALF